MLDQVFASGERIVANGAEIRYKPDPAGPEQVRYLDFVYEPIIEPGGEVSGIFCEGHDVTERHRANAAIAESEARLRAMADGAPVMMWVTDASGRCTYLNQRWYEYTGQAPGTGEGYGWLRAVHPDDRPAAKQAFLAANAEQRTTGWTFDCAALTAPIADHRCRRRKAHRGRNLSRLRRLGHRIDEREAELRLSGARNSCGWPLRPLKSRSGTWTSSPHTLFWPPRVKAMFGISPDVPVTMADFSPASSG
jgi:PAS domain-containing protein